MRIFLSYRRDDSAVACGRIFDYLEGVFGSGSVLKDIDSIPLGVDFRDEIDRLAHSSDIVLCIIGPKWVGPRESQKPRIFEDGDMVRLEVEYTLSQSKPLIPLLVDSAHMPSEQEIPTSLAHFPYINALLVRNDPDFRRDMERVVRSIQELVPSAFPRPWTFSGFARILVFVTLVISTIMLFFLLLIATNIIHVNFR